jgi:oligosaccharide reducing-end xylanase
MNQGKYHMRRTALFISIVLFLLTWLSACSTVPSPEDVAKATSTPAATTTIAKPPTPGEDAFQTLLGKSEAEVQAKIEAAWNHLFYGDENTERIYYEVGDDMAYILDINNNDIRSEGISYGMMIAVQLDKQAEFNRIWKWAKTYMYHSDGPYAGYFSWHNRPDGTRLDLNPAPDGEIWMTTALFFAAHRWGNGEGIFNYEAEANAILHAMLHKAEDNSSVTAMFDPESKLVVFVPIKGRVSQFSDPSYHVPHYYNLWAHWAAKDNDFWREATTLSRAYLKLTEHPETGLMPDYAEFDGTPVRLNGGNQDRFAYDAWRTNMNIALDYAWNQADPWQVEHINRVLNFFYGEGINRYKAEYTLAGEAQASFRGAGLISINGAAAAQAATEEHRREFVQALWHQNPPSGQYRYYDGLLYLMSLLIASGNFQVY